MYIATTIITRACGNFPDVKDKKVNATAKIMAASIVGEALLSITALVIGILGAVGVLHGLPPAAAYTLIGYSGLITLIWVIFTALSKGVMLKGARDLLQAPFSSDPKFP